MERLDLGQMSNLAERGKREVFKINDDDDDDDDRDSTEMVQRYKP